VSSAHKRGILAVFPDSHPRPSDAPTPTPIPGLLALPTCPPTWAVALGAPGQPLGHFRAGRVVVPRPPQARVDLSQNQAPGCSQRVPPHSPCPGHGPPGSIPLNSGPRLVCWGRVGLAPTCAPACGAKATRNLPNSLGSTGSRAPGQPWAGILPPQPMTPQAGPWRHNRPAQVPYEGPMGPP
jgi:hypothetical protein